MDKELRELERRWKRSRDEGDALAFLLRLAKAETLTLLQLWRHMVRIERMVSDPTDMAARDLPNWDQVAEWLQDTEKRLRPRSLLAQLQAAGAPPLPPTPALPRPPRTDLGHLPINRGYSREWLCATCTCGHERGLHEGSPEARTQCSSCGACHRFTAIPAGTCVMGCGRQTEAGYILCRAHLAEALRG